MDADCNIARGIVERIGIGKIVPPIYSQTTLRILAATVDDDAAPSEARSLAPQTKPPLR